MKEILFGLVSIIVGICLLIYTYKNSAIQLKSADLKGYVGGVAFVIIGILLLSGMVKM